MILGITGSSGAGKSTVCEILERKYSSQTIKAGNKLSTRNYTKLWRRYFARRWRTKQKKTG